MNSDTLALVLLLVGAGIAGAILYKQAPTADEEVDTGRTLQEEAIELSNECLWADHSTGFFAHYHPNLQIIIEGSEVAIPAETGTDTEVCREMMHVVHTHDGTGKLHVETYHQANVSLEVFFLIMGENFNSTQIFDRVVDAEHELIMTVDGVVSDDYQNLILADGQQIVIEYREKS